MLTDILPNWFPLVPEKEERHFASTLIPRHLDVVDLGAGRGQTGRRAVRRLAPGRRYLGLEMQRDLVPVAYRAVKASAPEGVSVQVIHGAICSTAPTVSVWDAGEWSACATTSGTDIPAFTLTRFLEEYGIRDDYSLLMDIEGGESDVIENDQRALERCRCLIVELHDGRPHPVNPWGASTQELLARLIRSGFHLVKRGRCEVYVLQR